MRVIFSRKGLVAEEDWLQSASFRDLSLIATWQIALCSEARSASAPGSGKPVETVRLRSNRGLERATRIPQQSEQERTSAGAPMRKGMSYIVQRSGFEAIFSEAVSF